MRAALASWRELRGAPLRETGASRSARGRRQKFKQDCLQCAGSRSRAAGPCLRCPNREALMVKAPKDKRGGQRQLKVRVRSTKQRSASSRRWLERQLNDPYVVSAQREGYRSRAAYKLIEIDDKYRFLKPGLRVVDLGAAPGGWSQVAAKRVQSVEGRGQVVAIDISEMEPL